MTDSEILDLRDDFVKRKLSCGQDYDEVDFIGFARAILAAQLAAPVLTACRHCGFRVALNEAPQGAAQ